MKISRNIHFLIFVYFIVGALVSDEVRLVLTIVLCGVLLAVRPERYAVVFLKLYPLLFAVMIALVVTVGAGQGAFNILKGAWYLTRPIFYILCGYLIARELGEPRLILAALLCAGVTSSLAYLIKYLSDPNVTSETRTYVRRMIGKGDMIMSVALAIAICAIYKGRRLFNLPRFFWIIPIAIVFAAIIASESRSFLLIAVLLLPFVTRWVPTSLLAWFIVPGLLILEFTATTPLLSYLVGDGVIRQWIAALPDFLNEQISMDRNSDQEINDFWRGFETYYAFSFVNNQGILNQLFGTGLGSLVPIPIEIKLGADTFTSIPIFHNGFSFIYVRTGAFGFLLYIIQISIFSSAIAGVCKIYEKRDILSSLLVGSVLMVCVTTPTVAGLYNYAGTGALLLGIGGGHYAFLKERYRRSRNLRL